ncbi:hypothetical protein DSC91_000140 [Paraburkholderia caffeinilytica]|uniref:Phage protein n=1 Tax=Paraburkholderia caffeinilytica TaxID=1761016 RepID=A0ABQ1N9G7_9BURK|nr:hypothetical protein [Paraburkholderia caffeinilytica]AXL48659.1 hypothetical protein DSC91_000140 [Paraburkholderia caffeinilytica]GGC62632.1 hypothetical protein GCM10011400_58070 [Paraburkholderia caffeinilytica]CAB3798242.1 hypothetical protein LMG28690_04707 [Paraburkholderia caffeinilytica]
MEPTWQFQLRITVSPELANDLRIDVAGASHVELRNVLRKHNATLKCQFDAFADYVSEAEQQGPENYPLYQWTRQTIENPQKKAKYLQSFTVYVNGDEIYGKEIAGVMEAELLALAGDDGIKSVARFDTNPANNPQPPNASDNT